MKFEELDLHPALLKAVKGMGFEDATPIQEKCIPPIRQGKDVVGHSSTGSGKTAAFGLPILEKIQPGKGLQALILTPTRELCVQVTEALREFGRYLNVRATSVYGGVGIEPQMKAITTADIVVGTPGRILDHLERRTISFGNIRFLVLDEADKMFDMGFVEAVERIISQVPRQRQTLLFSATFSSTIHDLVRKHMNAPISIKGETHVDKTLLKQVYYDVKSYDKFSLLVHLLKKATPGLALIFCATRREVDTLNKNLKMQGLNVMAIHGGLTQSRRLHALDSLKRGHISVLVATDVAARGLDIRDVSHVYNYDVPKTSEEYVHRIGRTARAGEAGDAVTLLAERDYENFNSVLRDRSLDIRKADLPQFEKMQFVREVRHSFERPHRQYGQQGGYGHRSSYGSSRGEGSYGRPRSQGGSYGQRYSERSEGGGSERRGGRGRQGYGSHRSSGSHSQ
ncbi:DEAD/DEAH box helicase [Candidatus Woesearchaeota archaeon]|nr:DEAD/DEAH box helicase [Candidatus Woesearchaeota archaeon]